MQVDRQLEFHRQTKLQAGGSKGIYSATPDQKGVTVAWLAEAFEMTEPAVRHKLRNCPVRATRIRGEKMQVKLYDLKVAARYLVVPAVSTKDYLRRLKAGDMPPQLQESVWNALLKRQKWEENAGTLWRTEAIREVLGGTFQTIKFTMQLWVETVERSTELSDAQRQMIVEMVDALQLEIYEALVKNMRENATGSQLTDLETMFGETDRVGDLIEDDEDDDDAIEALV